METIAIKETSFEYYVMDTCIPACIRAAEFCLQRLPKDSRTVESVRRLIPEWEEEFLRRNIRKGFSLQVKGVDDHFMAHLVISDGTNSAKRVLNIGTIISGL